MAAANSEAEHLKREYIFLSRLIESHTYNQHVSSAQHKPNQGTNNHYKVHKNYQTQRSCRGKAFKNLVYRPVDKGSFTQAAQTSNGGTNISSSLEIMPTKVKMQKPAVSPLPKPATSKARRRLSLTVAKSRYKLQKVHSVTSTPPQQQTSVSPKVLPAKSPDLLSCSHALLKPSIRARYSYRKSSASPVASGRSGSPMNMASKYKLVLNSTKAHASKCSDTNLTFMGARRIVRKYKVNNINRSLRPSPFKKCDANRSSSMKHRDFWQASYRKTHYYRGQKRPSASFTSTEVSPRWPHFINIGNITYRSFETKLLRTHRQALSKYHRNNKGSPNKAKVLVVRGMTYSLDPSGKTLQRIADCPAVHKTPLKRIDVGGKTYVETTPGMLCKTPSSETRTFLSRAINRSLSQVRCAKHRKYDSRASRYCMFFNRFGRCNKGDKCTYIHDPDKVAVCTRFLRGTCRVSKCPFSHRVSPDKMPVCSFFLRGCCTMDPCPYRHVKVNTNAEICIDFVRGYCSQGVKCKKQHVLICPEFAATNQCSKGKLCRLTHRKRRRPETGTSLESATNGTAQNTSCTPAKHTKKEPGDPAEAPTRGKLVRQPQYISLTASRLPQATNTSPDQKTESSSFKRSGVRIRPSFLP
ncbi:zinc finger CCCH domain-containing protein 3-like isoform X2 [Ornithodoros turicata]|uniref:zinc finger CCCH domain-containing protein 3-like isoform X2 n=1 Tax=Ornithodoros turicata TaxID=34597 RepID=UPI003138C8AA